MSKLKILYVPTLNSGVVYWRMWNFCNSMHRQGIAETKLLWWQKGMKETHPWERDISDPSYSKRIFLEMIKYARESDVVIMQIVHTPEALSAFYALKDACPSKFILAESDDNILDTPTYNPAEQVYRPGSGFVERAINQFKHADALIVSTPYLKEVYSEYNQSIYVTPNAIDLNHWGKVRRKSKPGIRIGWAGGASHEEDLRIIEPVIHEILAEHRDVTFNLVHGVPPFLRGLDRVEHEFKFERIDKYPQHIANQAWDIALAPLVDNSFNRSKSNLRWLEASALGIPIVASRVGHFAETIKDGWDGFLAADAREFKDKINILIKDKKLRHEMGKTAYHRIENDFNVDKVSRQYVETLKEIIALGHHSDPPSFSKGIEWENVKPLEPLPNEQGLSV